MLGKKSSDYKNYAYQYYLGTAKKEMMKRQNGLKNCF